MHEKKWYRFAKYVIGIALLVSISGCHVSSRTALVGSGGRNSYNESLKMTGMQQMLLNLVRLRYCDLPFFLDVSNVTTQFTFGSFVNPTFPIPGATNANPIELGAGMSWQNQPTIQYTPLGGQQFARQLMQPIGLLTIQQLILSGWDIDRVFKLTIQGMDKHLNAPTASGPVPDHKPNYESFYQIMELLREIQVNHHLQIGIKEGRNLIREDGSNQEYHPTALQLSFAGKHPDSKQLADMLDGTKFQNGRYTLDMRLAYDEEGEIGIMPRSLLGCMYYLSLSVHVPENDVMRGKAFSTMTRDGNLFNWNEMMGSLMNIRYSMNYPENSFVAIKYRNYWFYIDDCDSSSKKTFILLVLLYNLQSGNGDEKKQPTLLTIPLGR